MSATLASSELSFWSMDKNESLTPEQHWKVGSVDGDEEESEMVGESGVRGFFGFVEAHGVKFIVEVADVILQVIQVSISFQFKCWVKISCKEE